MFWGFRVLGTTHPPVSPGWRSPPTACSRSTPSAGSARTGWTLRARTVSEGQSAMFWGFRVLGTTHPPGSPGWRSPPTACSRSTPSAGSARTGWTLRAGTVSEGQSAMFWGFRVLGTTHPPGSPGWRSPPTACSRSTPSAGSARTGWTLRARTVSEGQSAMFWGFRVLGTTHPPGSPGWRSPPTACSRSTPSAGSAQTGWTLCNAHSFRGSDRSGRMAEARTCLHTTSSCPQD